MSDGERADLLTSPERLSRHLAALLQRDPRLEAVAAAAGPFDIRLTPGGFGGLARVICGQQVSVASARAIFGRLATVEGALDPAGFLALSPQALAGVGLSASKYRTLRAVAAASINGGLDYGSFVNLPAEEAIATLTAHPGIGPWTAEIYLMFCVGHPDIFPVGDLALRKAVGHAFGIDGAPLPQVVADIAAAWSPYRHAAALLFWKYYAQVLRKAGGIAL